MKRIIFLTAVLVCGSAKISRAFSLIEFQGGGQGRLVNLDGTPVRDSTRMMGFAIWTDSTGGTMLWSETQMVQTQAGLFNVYLGDSIPLTMDVFSHPAPRKYLEVSVAGEIFSPRTLLGASPLAQVACRLVGDLETGYDSIDQVGFIKKGVRIVGEAGQSANLMEIKDGAGAILLSIDPGGTISNFPNPVPIRIKAKTGSLYIGHGTAVSIVQQDSVTPADKLQEWQNSAGAPLVSIDANGDMDGLNSSWENLQAVDINCNGTLNVNGPAVVQADAGQTANLQEWRLPLPGGGSDTVAVVDTGGNVGIGTNAPHSTLQVDGSVALAIIRVAFAEEGCLGLGPFKITAKNTVIVIGGSPFFGCQACGAELPSAVGIKGRAYTIKNFPSSGCFGAEPITTVGGETIDGDPSYLLQPKKYVTVISDGANWLIIGSN